MNCAICVNPILEMMKIIRNFQWTWSSKQFINATKTSHFTFHIFLSERKKIHRNNQIPMSATDIHDNGIFFCFSRSTKWFACVLLLWLIYFPVYSHVANFPMQYNKKSQWHITHNKHREKNSHMFHSCVCDYHKWETARKWKPQLQTTLDSSVISEKFRE